MPAIVRLCGGVTGCGKLAAPLSRKASLDGFTFQPDHDNQNY